MRFAAFAPPDTILFAPPAELRTFWARDAPEANAVAVNFRCVAVVYWIARSSSPGTAAPVLTRASNSAADLPFREYHRTIRYSSLPSFALPRIFPLLRFPQQ